MPILHAVAPLLTDHSPAYAMDQNYIPPMRVSQPTTSAGSSAYAQQTTSSNPSLYQSRGPEPRRHSELPVSSGVSAYDQYRRISSPYDGQTTSNYSMPPTQTIPSISGLAQSPLPSPHLSSPGAQISPQYTTRFVTSPSITIATYVSNVDQITIPLREHEPIQPTKLHHSSSLRDATLLHLTPLSTSTLHRQQHKRNTRQLQIRLHLLQQSQRPIRTRLEPTPQTTMLGTRLQRTTILDLQQSPPPSERKVRHSE